MKSVSVVFLQAVIVLIGIVAMAILLYFPTTEGRATNLDLISIYTDPLILYVYVASIAFFCCAVPSLQITWIHWSK
jgi:hypothetical protein